MKAKTNLKAGGIKRNNNETLVRDGGLKLKTHTKAGRLAFKVTFVQQK